MTHHELRELEATRRKALWLLASLPPGDSKASDALAILDDLDRQQLNDTRPTGQPLTLEQLRHSVSVERHHSGIDIVLELNIPQPWRERFLQASIGSTRLVDGPYATDWKKFLVEWEVETRHLEAHRTARHTPKQG
ncbi:hypothetical protein AM274_01855 [Pseudomonas nunensis]|nr:hypothetical protein [Pseudomonas nunensis]KOY04334.1 hypothetical protein AM274_01855 [Pseudomonas nunensis]